MAGLKGPRGHRHTKLNRYTGNMPRRKRSRGFRLWWIIPISGIFAVIFALCLGNCLGDKADNGVESSTPTEAPEINESLPPETADVSGIDAVFVGLEGITDNTNAEVTKQIPEGTKAISLSMFYSNGAPLYSSEVAEASGEPSGELTLGNIFKYANENDIYVSVPFPSSVLASKESPLSEVRAAYEIALIKELHEAGADEVIIRCSAFGTESPYSIENEDFAHRLCSYLSDLRYKLPELHIGFMISATEAADSALSAAIDKINGYADFIAVDMTDVSEADDLTEAASSAIVSILRYEMRLLLGGGDEEALAPLYSALDSLGMKNRQVATKNN